MALHVDDQRDPGAAGGARLERLAAVACSYKAPGAGAGAQWHEQREISETKYALVRAADEVERGREGERERGREGERERGR
jgi:hypothetical protein